MSPKSRNDENATAAAREEERERLAAFLKEMEEKFGPIDQSLVREVEAVWQA